MFRDPVRRWFVTFIDCFSRYTWLYLLKHKSDVLSVFKDLFALIQNQFGTSIKVLRSDNGTEYINLSLGSFLPQMELNTRLLALTLQSKTVLQNVKINTCLRLLTHLCLL